MKVIDRLESNVRGYCRSFPTTFATGRGSQLFDKDGGRYIDFFAGAGVLNYGHNHPDIKAALLAFLETDAIIHGLDLATEAKEAFLEAFDEVILAPRNLDYKVQFPGPTGTNAVEAALKLARKVTGRSNVIAFTNAFHGMTAGSLAITGNASKRAGAGIELGNVTRVPFEGYAGVDSLALLDTMLTDTSSGVDKPAAVILETVQAEGGVNVASNEWLRRLREITAAHGVLLIVDDIQVGCGRTGRFFSFEEAGIVPDIVCLSKALSGLGLPFALVLMKRDLDVWAPGEHNGTFRGFNPAFVTAIAALEFWKDDYFAESVARGSKLVRKRLEALAERFPEHCVAVRGRGLIMALECRGDVASRVSKAAFERGLIIETAGATDQVIKVLPPLTTTAKVLHEGLDILEDAMAAVIDRPAANADAPAELPAEA